MLSAARRQNRETPSGQLTGSSPERRCLVSRESCPVEQLIRFVVGPGNEIVPDLDGRLPGRGLWLRASRDIVDDACRTRVFPKAARTAVRVDDGLADRIEGLLAHRCLNFLGLARRAGLAVGGFEKVRAALSGGKPGVVLIASDAGEDGRGKVLSIVGGQPVIELFSGSELGSVFGRDRTVYAVIESSGLSTRFVNEACRLAGFRTARTA